MTDRPFYGEFAWAYDFVVAPDAEGRCDFIADALARRGVARGSRLLDAGCGAGAYSLELARRGFVVEGLDLSPELVAAARARAATLQSPRAPTPRVTFAVGDVVRTDAPARYDAILCRGVLNDLLDDGDRREVFHTFARSLRAGGVLLFDVREWGMTAERKSRAPVAERTVETPRGTLTFRDETRLDREGRRLLVAERHTLRRDGVERVAEFDFEMRCWTRAEVSEALAAAGFRGVEDFGAYDFSTAAGTTDRLVCAASSRESREES